MTCPWYNSVIQLHSGSYGYWDCGRGDDCCTLPGPNDLCMDMEKDEWQDALTKCNGTQSCNVKVTPRNVKKTDCCSKLSCRNDKTHVTALKWSCVPGMLYMKTYLLLDTNALLRILALCYLCRRLWVRVLPRWKCSVYKLECFISSNLIHVLFLQVIYYFISLPADDDVVLTETGCFWSEKTLFPQCEPGLVINITSHEFGLSKCSENNSCCPARMTVSFLVVNILKDWKK